MSEDGQHTNYVKIWAILVVLLIISVIGPEIGIRWVTLMTAFGIACVKAYMVADKFMHIGEMPKFISYIVVTSVVFMVLLFAGSAMPSIGWTHLDGVEAADPATPAALLTFNSAVAGYTALGAAARTWRARFAGDSDSNATSHSDHTGAAPATPATMQR